MASVQGSAEARLGSTHTGEYLRVREDIYKQLHEREWIFSRRQDNLIFLIHKKGTYGLVVGPEDIDWTES